MTKTLKSLYQKHGESKFKILFAIGFSLLTNLLAIIAIKFLLGSEIVPVRIAVYTVGFFFVGLVQAKMRIAEFQD